MKHLLHIGVAKSATSWLWHQISSDLDLRGAKEDEFFRYNNSVYAYFSKYASNKTTANFATNMHTIDRWLIQGLASLPLDIRCSISLRSPKEYAASWYNWNNNTNLKDFAAYFVDTRLYDYFSYIVRWQEFFPDIGIFFYDDLVTDSKKYYKNYCNFASIVYNIDNKDLTIKRNIQPKYFTVVPFDKQQIRQINTQTEKLESLTQRNLESWIL